MLGRMVASLRSRGITRRPSEYTAASFLQMMRAYEEIYRTRSAGVALRASTIRLIAPIVFDETVVYPSGFDGVSIVSEPSLEHELGSGVTVAFDVQGEDHRFSGLRIGDSTGTFIRSVGALTHAVVDGCRVGTENLFNGQDNTNLRCSFRDNFGASSRGSIIGAMTGCSVSRNINIEDINSSGENMNSCTIEGNILSGNIDIDGASNRNILNGNLAVSIRTNSSAGNNIVDSNSYTSTLSTHGTDTVGDNG